MKLDYMDIARIVRRDDSDVVVACLAIVGGVSEADIVLTMQKTLQRKLDTLGRELSDLEQLVNVKATSDNDLPLSIVNAAIEHRQAWRADVRNAADQLRRLSSKYRQPVKLTLAQAVQTLRDQQLRNNNHDSGMPLSQSPMAK